MECMGNVYKMLVGKPEGKRPLGTRRWEDNIGMDLREVGREVVEEWTHLNRDRDQWRVLVNTVMKFWVP
jgi:hypothetical protein